MHAEVFSGRMFANMGPRVLELCEDGEFSETAMLLSVAYVRQRVGRRVAMLPHVWDGA